MNSANINDAAAIQTLLDQLKSSEAWQRVVSYPDAVSQVAANPLAERHETANPSSLSRNISDVSFSPHEVPQADTGPSRSFASGETSKPHSVAALLSQLQASSGLEAIIRPSRMPSFTSAQPTVSSPSEDLSAPGPDIIGTSNNTLPPAPHTPRQDLRACTFQQALPHLARLAEDLDFLKALTAMRTEQTELERQLHQERRDIQRKHEERVKAARTKATIIGAGLTQYEADALTDSFRTELLKFDRERVLVAWDGLVTKQQNALEALGVPAMFPTTQALERERQERIMQVLGGINGSEESSPTHAPGIHDG